MIDLKELGQKIRLRREKKQWNQSEIADALGVSIQAVSKWERGVNAPDLGTLHSLSKLLETSLDYLLEREGELQNTIEATLLLNSLQGFAKESRTLPAEELAHKVNGIHHTSTECLLANGGVPIKYTGDGGLGFVSGQNQIERAFEIAEKWFRLLKDSDLVVVLWKGPIYVGLIGHQDYAARDVLGKTVNEAFLLSSWVCDQGIQGLFSNVDLTDLSKFTEVNEMKNVELSHGVHLDQVWHHRFQ